jgi:hypothetical protein
MCTSLLVASCWLALPALAQTPPAPASQPAPLPPSPRVERITHEDKLSRIDELRVGGQTQSIEVQPKNGAPAYQIAPQRSTDSSGNGPNQRSGNAGKSTWRVLKF